MLIQKIKHPETWCGYYAPSYDLTMKIGWPRICQMLDEHGIGYKVNKNEKIITTKGYGGFVFRSMDNPESLIGYEHADAFVDELDTLKTDDAAEVWRRILSRNRGKKKDGSDNTIAVATTPEGFRFVYQTWHRDPKEGYQLFRASTYSNIHNLEKNYVSNLQQMYSPALLAAYVNGEFVNLTSGSVYPDFDRTLNDTKETRKAGEQLHIGMDFNVYNMAAVVFVIRDDKPIAVGEFTKIRDTPAMIEAIRARYGFTQQITVYPDPAGKATSSKNASVSDILLLRQAGFLIQAMTAHPTIKDRINSVNSLLLNSAGQRRLTVNLKECKSFGETLEQQVYDPNGVPDKKAGLDHVGDAAGYFLYRMWPVGVNTRASIKIMGF